MIGSKVRRKRTPRSAAIPPTLTDSSADGRLSIDGYVVIDLLNPSQVATLLDLAMLLHPAPRSTWESDFYSPVADEKRAAHDGIAATLVDPIRSTFVDHRSVLHNFVINWPGDDGGLVLHQHSTVVDPTRFRSVIVWCALNDADETNGTLHVVPRSHAVQQGPRPERSPSWHEPHTEQLLAEHLVSVPVRAGQALVFDNQLLHCSFPNRSDAPRITAGAAVIPRGAQPRVYEWVDDSTVDVYRLDPEFFLTHQAGDLEWAEPDGLEHLFTEPWSVTAVPEGALADLIPRGTCRHDGRHWRSA